MELVGDEKRIPALFRELRIEDEQLTAPFALTWARVVSSTYQPRRAFNLPVAVATLLLICSLIALGLWSRRLERTAGPVKPNTPVAAFSHDQSPPPGSESILRPEPTIPVRKPSSVARRRIKLKAAPVEMQEAMVIYTWQSPTATLLNSPSSEILVTLPQLDEYTNEMKSFLRTEPK